MPDEVAVATDQAMQDLGVQDSGMEQPEAQSTFFDMSFDDGETVSFKDKDELAKWVKESALRQKDYTKKTQSVAEQRRQFEQQQAEHKKRVEKELEAIQQAKAKWDKYEQAFKKRPQIYQQLERLASQPASPDEIFQRSQSQAEELIKPLQEKLERLEAERERERLERQRDEVYARLSEQYGDFDREQVNEVLATLEEGNLQPLLEMALKASRYNPDGAEAKVLEKLQRKQGAKIPSGGGQPPPKSTGPTDPKAAYEEALSEYAGIK